MKVDIEQLEEILSKNNLEKEIIIKVVKDCQQVAVEEKEEREGEKEPKQKNQYGIILFDNFGHLNGKDFTGSVFQIPINADMNLVLGQIQDAAKEFNTTTRKGKKNPIKNFTESIGFVSRKFFKSRNILLKNKTPVQVLVTKNDF